MQFVESLLAAEKEFSIQQKFNDLLSAMNNLASQPQQAQFQTDVAAKLGELETVLLRLSNDLSPAELALVSEIGGVNYFTTTASNSVRDLIAKNAMTPAVVQQGIQSLTSKRQDYLNTLQKLRDGMKSVGIAPLTIEYGEAEIGFLIPRPLFENNLDGLWKELKVIDRILSIFSESVSGRPETAVVRQISSSDPTFFFGLGVATIVVIGKTITWLLDTYKKGLEIKDLHHRAHKAGLPADALAPFEEHIKKSIDRAIETRISEILGPKEIATARGRELENGLRWAMNSLIARIERGMTVEIRFLPPPQPEEGETTTTDAETTDAFKDLDQITSRLEFPPLQGSPIISLPAAPPENGDSKLPKQ
ncbi:MAG: hypothetical protein U1E49_18085 [Hyphomicrobiaceae bacterium]